MKKVILLAIILSKLIFPDKVSADFNVVSVSGQIKKQSLSEFDDYRVARVREFLNKLNSPLENYAQDFVLSADKYNLDWRLVVSISGVESTFGKNIPKGSYNAYGWANGAYKFKSWEDSIEVVSRSLRQKYYDRGAVNINKISRRYAPPSSTWARKVKYFMEKIEPLPLEFDL